MSTILLADDSLTIQKVVELTFADTEHEVLSVSDGKELLERLPEARPDLVICDVIMPGLDGYQVCEQIKSAPDTLHVPVILLTGTFEPFDRDRALAAGCSDIITKPFEARKLVDTVERLLSPGAAAAPVPTEQISTPAGTADEDDFGTRVATPDERAPAASPPPPADEAAEELEFTTGGFAEMEAAGAEESDDSVPDEGLEFEIGEDTAARMAAAASSQPTADPGEPFPEPPALEIADVTDLGEDEGITAEPFESSPAEVNDEPSDEAATPPELSSTAPIPPPVVDEAVERGAPTSGEITDTWDSAADAVAGRDADMGNEPFATPPTADMDEDFLHAETEAELEPPDAVEEEPRPTPPTPPAEPALPSPQARPDDETLPEPLRASTPAPPVEPPAPPAEPPTPPPQPSTAEMSPGPVAGAPAGQLSDEDVERIARRVAELASERIEQIAWEVIPDMAELVVRERIRQLEQEAGVGSAPDTVQ